MDFVRLATSPCADAGDGPSDPDDIGVTGTGDRLDDNEVPGDSLTIIRLGVAGSDELDVLGDSAD